LNELQRLAYLDAMGVETYYPRLQLIGARPSTQCEMPARVAVQPRQAAADVASLLAAEPKSTGGRPLNVRELLDIPANSKAGVSVEPARIEASPENAPSYSLNVTLIHGSLLLVDDCPAPQLHSGNYRKLLHNMVFALGLGKQAIENQPFHWPEAMKGHHDQGAEVAGEALQAYLARQVERGEVKYLLLMGADANRYAINTDLPVGVLSRNEVYRLPVLSTLSASRMLQEPALKRQLWQQLQPLYQAITGR